MNAIPEKRLAGGLRFRSVPKRHLSANPLVSIITVILNIVGNGREGFFNKLVESVQQQDYGRQNIEHIIIDGGSTDGTLDIIRKLDSEGIIDYWVSEKDSGIYSAMNKGIEASTGSLINFLNSDDYFTIDAVSSSVNCLLSSGADFSYGKALVVDKFDHVIRERWMWALQYLYFGMPFCHQTMFIKKDWFGKVGLFDEGYKISGDWDFVLKAFLQGASPVFVDRVLVRFRAEGISDNWADNAVAQQEKRELIKRNYLSRTPFTETEICDLESFLMKPLTTHLAGPEIDRLTRKFQQPDDIVLDFFRLLAYSIVRTRGTNGIRNQDKILKSSESGRGRNPARSIFRKAKQVLRNFGI